MGTAVTDGTSFALHKHQMDDVVRFVSGTGPLFLRLYQQEVARAIIASVRERRGLSFVVLFPRQSGKNELQAQIEAYLLLALSPTPAELVKVSPTWRPQSLNAMRRLERVLSDSIFARERWVKESGHIYRIGRARLTFLSGAAASHIVGATANTLLECDEAQEVLISKWDKEIAPMAASTNATRVFWGTAWTSRSLLARELRLARQAEQEDGLQRAFVLTADRVGLEVPPYQDFVAGQVARLGRSHPMVRTQFYSEEIDAQGGMFHPQRLALMQGSHPPQAGPRSGACYALALDVAGEDESARSGLEALAHTGRDATALTVFEIDLSGLADPLIARPAYRTVCRQAWVGVKHTALYASLRAAVELWQPRSLVVDATGVGAGLASFLAKAYPQVIPFVFTAATKSKLGWDFLSIVETGRYKDYAANPDDPAASLARQFWRQAEFCQYEIVEGPQKIMRWGVPEGSRDPATGEPVHDDLLISAALCAALDEQPWGLAHSAIVQAADPLRERGEWF